MNERVENLDNALARSGQDVTLRRKIGASNPIRVDVVCRAHVRAPGTEHLKAGYKQTDSVVIMSPTQILRAQWPGGQPEGTIEADRWPRQGDFVVIDGRERKIEHCEPIRWSGDVVRLELRVLGPA